jgi:hypothetical protein
MAWEDATHLVLTFRVAQEEEIVRMDLQGHLHRTTGALRVHVGETGFVLATQAVPPTGR